MKNEMQATLSTIDQMSAQNKTTVGQIDDLRRPLAEANDAQYADALKAMGGDDTTTSAFVEGLRDAATHAEELAKALVKLADVIETRTAVKV